MRKKIKKGVIVLFSNRKHAGKLLAQKLAAMPFDKTNTIVLAIPRGGVPVAYEVARLLNLPLDIMLVKKLGAPHYPELAVGSVSEDNEIFYNQQLLKELMIDSKSIDHQKELALIKLQEVGSVLRAGSTPLILRGKNVIVVDDGIATGSTMEVVIQVLKKRKVGNITIAAPVSSADSVEKLNKQVNRVVVLNTPNPIYSVGEWYGDYSQVETDEVVTLLKNISTIIPKYRTFNNAELS
ncbi:MAG: phosphoribosyltransferase [Alphaproteobacteria bacterium]|nr:MAG: phosphoribosyltransferase [Alphaproteobacteria bacterium]